MFQTKVLIIQPSKKSCDNIDISLIQLTVKSNLTESLDPGLAGGLGPDPKDSAEQLRP